MLVNGTAWVASHPFRAAATQGPRAPMLTAHTAYRSPPARPHPHPR